MAQLLNYSLGSNRYIRLFLNGYYDMKENTDLIKGMFFDGIPMYYSKISLEEAIDLHIGFVKLYFVIKKIKFLSSHIINHRLFSEMKNRHGRPHLFKISRELNNEDEYRDCILFRYDDEYVRKRKGDIGNSFFYQCHQIFIHRDNPFAKYKGKKSFLYSNDLILAIEKEYQLLDLFETKTRLPIACLIEQVRSGKSIIDFFDNLVIEE